MMRFLVIEVTLEEVTSNAWRLTGAQGPLDEDLATGSDWASWVDFANAVGGYGWELIQRSYFLNSNTEQNGAVTLLFKRAAAGQPPSD